MPAKNGNGHPMSVLLSFIAEQRKANREYARLHAEYEKARAEYEKEHADYQRQHKEYERRIADIDAWRVKEDSRMHQVAVLLEAAGRALKSLDRRVTRIESGQG